MVSGRKVKSRKYCPGGFWSGNVRFDKGVNSEIDGLWKECEIKEIARSEGSRGHGTECAETEGQGARGDRGWGARGQRTKGTGSIQERIYKATGAIEGQGFRV